MKYCGVVTDRSWANALMSEHARGVPEGHDEKVQMDIEYRDRPRIFSDEVPIASSATLHTLWSRGYVERVLNYDKAI